uniref:Uncharacterized protein n=1 Tax=Knipowitschia caucasica TaxID=637954 RepID=A0AAV2MHF4_KNICA
MFGLTPGGDEEESTSHSEYADKWRKRILEAYRIASKSDSKGQARAKNYYDRKAYGAELQLGSRVLVRNLSQRGGPGKLRSYWEEKVHVVVEKKSDTPVYVIKPERGPGKTRVIHRNLLLPCDYLPIEDMLQKPKPVQRKISVRRAEDKTSDTEDSDSEAEWQVIISEPIESSAPAKHRRRTNAEEFHPQQTPRHRDTSIKEEHHSGRAPEGQLSSDDVRGVEQAAMEQDEPGDGCVVDECPAAASDEADDPATLRQYPSRFRKPPKTFTYNTLGQPSLT